MRAMSSQPTGMSDEGALLPIHTVARRFGMRASTLRYYEERDLVVPVSLHSGRRWYGPEEIRRLAVIRFWQRQGLMSLEAIRELLDGSSSHTQWQEIVQRHIRALQQQVEQLQQVQSYIAQSLACEYHDRLDDCPNYEALIWGDLDEEGVGPPARSGPTSPPPFDGKRA
ncbi:MerR family transcriptional regulator [Streptomyces sp. NPDC050560]|uniref:MerR family transcriptional regulator n=1 Tax=Streptomyces sp. NPDC050560 TaxID=3365630 RepID=UPI0037B9BDFF